MLDNQGVHYSTNLNSFETMLVGLFDKAIGSTQNVPQLEKVRGHHTYIVILLLSIDQTEVICS